MPKRPPKGYGSSTIDVFDDDIGRAADALAAATAPVEAGAARAAPAPAPAPAEERVEKEPPPSTANVVSMPPASERQADATEKAERTPVRRSPAPAKTEATSTKKSPETPAEEPQRVPEKNVGLKFRVPQSVKSDFQTFMAELSAALGGVSLDDSNIGRPVLEILLLEHRDRILQAAKEHRGELKRPTNRDVIAMAEFDEALGAVIREGVATRRPSRGNKARE